MNNNLRDKIVNNKYYPVLNKILSVVISVVMIVIITKVLLSFEEMLFKFFFLPFYLCWILYFVGRISKAFNNSFLYNICYKGYAVVFLLFWYGWTTFFAYDFIIKQQEYLYIIICLMFYIMGAAVFKKVFLKK